MSLNQELKLNFAQIAKGLCKAIQAEDSIIASRLYQMETIPYAQKFDSLIGDKIDSFKALTETIDYNTLQKSSLNDCVRTLTELGNSTIDNLFPEA